MSELQVRKDDLTVTRLVDDGATAESMPLADGEVRAKIDRFAFTSNNITYGVAGDQLGYWQFFPPAGNDTAGWGLLPVWGFADIVQSNAAALPEGERLFGYFPPAEYLTLLPTRIAEDRFVDGAAHRAALPAGYNTYRRVAAESGYDRANDAARMLFWPLHVTSFCLWDALAEAGWYSAEQVIVLSASSKTSIGLGYALDMDKAAPPAVGITSSRSLAFVRSLGIYDVAIAYDQVEEIDAGVPCVIVDMSGNDKVLHALNNHLGDNMKHCLRVGVTHRDEAGRGERLERSAFFFAPSHIEKRIQDWGPAGFLQKSAAFVATTSRRSQDWLKLRELDGLESLAAIFPDIADGRIPADEGLIVRP